MLTISAREANHQFSRILETAANGETVTITRRGVPVVRMVPVVEEPSEADAEKDRLRREEEILAMFDEGFEGQGFADWTREELYERDHEVRG
jgi:prevent-host-death family protein